MNRRLTKLERAGIFLSQIAMWGTASTLLDKEHASSVNRWLNKNLEMPEAVKDLFIEGAITSYFRDEGIEVNEGIEGAGILSGAYNLVQTLLDDNNNEVSFQVPGALNFKSRAGSVIKAALDLAYGVTSDDEFNALKYAHSLATDPNMATGLRNGAKAFIGWYHQKAFNTKGAMISDTVTKKQSIGMLFGGSLLDSSTSAELYNIYSDMNKYVTELYEDGLAPIVEEIALDLNMSPENRRNLMNKYSTTMNAHRKMIHDTYGSAGLKAYNKLVRQHLSKQTIADRNTKYSRQYGEVILKHLSNFYNRSEQ